MSTRLPNSGRVLEPRQRLAQPHDLADDRDRRRRQSRPPATRSAMSASVPVTVRCSGVVPQRITAAGVSDGRPFAISFSTISGSVFVPIRKTSVSTAGRQLRPVDARFRLLRVLVPGDHRKCRRQAAVRDGNPSVSRHRDRRRDARHDLERDARRPQRLRLLSPAPEDERIAALQAHDALALARLIDEQPVDRLLVVRFSGDLAHEDKFGLRLRLAREARPLTSRSYTTTSASFSRWSPATVISPGSPGPAPTRYTVPGSLTPSPPAAPPAPLARINCSRQQQARRRRVHRRGAVDLSRGRSARPSGSPTSPRRRMPLVDPITSPALRLPPGSRLRGAARKRARRSRPRASPCGPRRL